MAVIRSSLNIAEKWEAKGIESWENIWWSNSSIRMALMNLLSVAVEEYADHTTAEKWLLENGTHSLLRRTYENLRRIISEVDAGNTPASSFGGNYNHLVFAHLSWTLQDFPLGESFIAIAERNDSCEISTPFWCEYAKAMGSFIRSEPYEVRQLRDCPISPIKPPFDNGIPPRLLLDPSD